jgi:hypothetical protein
VGLDVVLHALQAEVNNIKAEQDRILSDLRSGDFTKQRLACHRLSALAENHFPDWLPTAINLISDANRLDDQIRERTLSKEQRAMRGSW